MDIEILEKLISKRNLVYKIILHEGGKSKTAILKKFPKEHKKFLDMEYKHMLMLLDLGLSIPKVLYRNNDSLIIEYIEGELVADLVERLDKGKWIDRLALWLSELHGNEKKVLKGDVNLRNFIYSHGKIYGVDFEELKYGDRRIDLGNISFFILTHRPSFGKEKDIIIRQFFESYERYSGIELNSMDKFLLQAKIEAKKRRNISQ